MRRFRSLAVRMVASHIIVPSLTTIIVWLVIIVVQIATLGQVQAADYRGIAVIKLAQWQAQAPDGQPNPQTLPDGFTMVVGPDNKVLHTTGNTTCRAGKALA